MNKRDNDPSRNGESSPQPQTTRSPAIPEGTRYLRDPAPSHASVEIVRAENDGGPMRTFNGGQMHENGWFASRKAARLLHWQGTAQRDCLVRAEVEFGVVRMASESPRFVFRSSGGEEVYTADLELEGSDGITTVVEIKRDQRDLSDPDYRAKLARVKAACQAHGMRFTVVFRNDIWVSIAHRRNATRFANRAFTNIRPEHLDRLERHRRKVGPHTSFGELADAIEPADRRCGEAVVQALTVARRIEIDLTRPIFDATRVTMH